MAAGVSLAVRPRLEPVRGRLSSDTPGDSAETTTSAISGRAPGSAVVGADAGPIAAGLDRAAVGSAGVAAAAGSDGAAAGSNGVCARAEIGSSAVTATIVAPMKKERGDLGISVIRVPFGLPEFPQRRRYRNHMQMQSAVQSTPATLQRTRWRHRAAVFAILLQTPVATA
jgi:hypothetical protein